MDFTNQVAIVTGGSRGIGRAIVVALAQRGATVVACYHEQHNAAAETLRQCEQLPGAVFAYAADVRDAEAVAALVKHTITLHTHVHILINAAGIATYTPIQHITSEEWHHLVETNITGTYHMCRAVLRHMMRRRYGRIVNVAGLHGISGFPGQAAYCATMGGMLGLTRSLAREAVAWNITVNAVAPGFIETDMLAVVPPAMRAWGEQTIAQRRAGTPEEVAAAAIFFASPLASYITGQTLPVDGGWTMT